MSDWSCARARLTCFAVTPDEVSSCEPQGIAQVVDCFTFDFRLMPCLSPCSVQGWQATSKPVFEIHSLERSVKGNSVPMPKSVIRLILNSVLPRLLQRKLLRVLPQELGEYLLQAGEGFGLGGKLHACCMHGHVPELPRCLSVPVYTGSRGSKVLRAQMRLLLRHSSQAQAQASNMCSSLGQPPSAC